MRNHFTMAEKDALQRVCLEPLLYCYKSPRTIAAALTEYEQHLQKERVSARQIHATLSALERFLEPLEAPLASLTPELVRTLVEQEALRWEEFIPGSVPTRCMTERRARRFFSWAASRGYVTRNPWSEVLVEATVADPAELSGELLA